jgi:signal transduction histidine kinase
MQIGPAEIVRIIREATWARVAFAILMALVAVSVLSWQICLAWAAAMSLWELTLRPFAEDRLVLNASPRRGIAWVAALNFIGGCGYAVFPMIAWSSGEALGMVLATGWVAGAANHLFIYFMGNRAVTLATLAPLLACALSAPFVTQGVHVVSALGVVVLVALIAAAGVFGFDRQVLARAHARSVAALMRAKEGLEAKARLLANLSAELRAPLNDIVGYSELVEEEASGKSVDDARRIRVSAQHLLRFVGVVSDVAKLESGAASLNREVLPAHILIKDVSESARSLATVRGVSVSFREASPLGDVDIDHLRTHQCMVHILSHAISHARSGEVRVEARRKRRGGMEVLSLCTLPGPDADAIRLPALEHIGTAEASNVLAFARDMARCMGGDVEIDERSRIEFWVPVKSPD